METYGASITVPSNPKLIAIARKLANQYRSAVDKAMLEDTIKEGFNGRTI